ncbi:MAG: MFS transporter [Methanobacteriota archaeon]
MADKRERWFYSYLPTNMAGGCFDSLLPIFVVLALNGSVADVSMISVGASAASVPALIFWGAATDSFKWRKHFLVAGFLGRTIAYIAMGLSVDVGHLLFANILMGLLSAASGPAMTILVFEMFSKDKWAEKTGLFNKIAGVGYIAGIAFGTVWLAFVPQWMGIAVALRALFIVNAVMALVGAWLAFTLVIEPEQKHSRDDFHEHVVQLMRWSVERTRYLPGKMFRWFRLSHARVAYNQKGDGHFGSFLASTFIYTIGAVSFFTIMPVYLLKEVHVDKTYVFALSFIQVLASTVLFSRFGKILDRVDKTKALLYAKLSRLGLFVSYAVAAPIAIWNPLAAITVLIVIHLLLGVSWAVIGDTQLPIAVGSGPDENKGALAGTFNATVGLGAIAGGAFGGIVATILGFELSIIASAALVGLSAAVLYATMPENKSPAA